MLVEAALAVKWIKVELVSISLIDELQLTICELFSDESDAIRCINFQ